MAAKDADLAHDYSTLELVLTGEVSATLAIDTTHLDALALLPTPTNTLTLFLVGEKDATLIADLQGVAAAGSSIIYRMRGFDQNGAVNDFVSWNAAQEDPTAAQYTGSAGPVIDIRLIEIIG